MTQDLTTAAPNPFVRYFQVALKPGTWLATTWLLLALPLGVAAFTYVVTLASLGLGLSITIVGIPLLIAFLFSVRALAEGEARLASLMLGVPIERASFVTPCERPGILARTGAMLKDSLTWRGLLYLLLRMPIGIGTFTLAVTLLALCFGLMIAPLTYDGAHVQLFSLRADTLAAAWACALTGLLLFPAALHVLNGAAWICGQLARVLLQPAAPAVTEPGSTMS